MIQIGQRFGRLVVVRRAPAYVAVVPCWAVRCDCGGRRVVRGKNLTCGHTRSCGCLHSERVRAAKTVHGHSRDTGRSAEYAAWRGLIGGGRHVVAWAWRMSFVAFLQGVGPRPPGHLLGRRDQSMPFGPGNTLWQPRRRGTT